MMPPTLLFLALPLAAATPALVDRETGKPVPGYENLAAGGVIRLSALQPGRYLVELRDASGPVVFRVGAFEHTAAAPPFRLPLWNKALALPAGRHTLAIRPAAGPAVTLTLEASRHFDPYDLLFEGKRPPAGRRPTAWAMHEIDTPPDPLPNGLDGADANGDGFLDFATNYEHSGRIRVALHPGKGGDPRKPWPSVVIGQDKNAESVAFADFDGDGSPDVAAAHGVEDNQSTSGVKIFWGPKPGDVRDGKAWIDSGDIPASRNGGQYTYIRARDMNGDGRPEIVVGGRRNGRASQGDRPYSPDDIYAGIRWFEPPANPAARRDMAQWKMHFIDRDIKGSYGFQFGDIDGDGGEDIAVTNSDWDTREPDRMIVWYQNPGRNSPALRQPWGRYVVSRTSELYTKPQAALGDLDGDKRLDLVVQPTVEDKIHWYRNKGGQPVEWERIDIQKPPITTWRSRPTKLFDLNGDGRMDIVGALIHRDGRLPLDKASVFWMEYTGARPGPGNWKTHVIKWSDGYIGSGKFVGEKWDLMQFYDVDGDGDTDIVADVEEYHEARDLFLGVVWFENPAKKGAAR